MGFFNWLESLLADPPCQEKRRETRAANPKPAWPNTTAPDKTDPHWEFNSKMWANGDPYRKQEVSPGKWQWVVDEELARQAEEADRRHAENEHRKRELFWALRSRVLTDEEMEEVNRHGDNLNIPTGVCYSQEEKSRALNDALLQQYRLRAAAASAAPLNTETIP